MRSTGSTARQTNAGGMRSAPCARRPRKVSHAVTLPVCLPMGSTVSHGPADQWVSAGSSMQAPKVSHEAPPTAQSSIRTSRSRFCAGIFRIDYRGIDAILEGARSFVLRLRSTPNRIFRRSPMRRSASKRGPLPLLSFLAKRGRRRKLFGAVQPSRGRRLAW